MTRNCHVLKFTTDDFVASCRVAVTLGNTLKMVHHRRFPERGVFYGEYTDLQMDIIAFSQGTDEDGFSITLRVYPALDEDATALVDSVQDVVQEILNE